jgi:hypothetical protein
MEVEALSSLLRVGVSEAESGNFSARTGATLRAAIAIRRGSGGRLLLGVQF